MSGLAGGETALEQMKVSLLRVDNPGVKPPLALLRDSGHSPIR